MQAALAQLPLTKEVALQSCDYPMDAVIAEYLHAAGLLPSEEAAAAK